MKKLVLTSMVVALGAALAHAQGTIAMSSTAAEVYTNGAAAGGAGYDLEVLDMVSSTYSGLSANNQAAAYDLFANPTAISLWTDSTVSGTTSSLHAGGITSAGGAATGWAGPTSSSGYSSAPSYDYYTIVGWSASAGTWATISADLADGTLPTGMWFGQTGAAFNYAGGGTGGEAAVNLFAASTATGLAGSGGLPTTDALTLSVPEPTTLALAGLGGISVLFLRRRKA